MELRNYKFRLYPSGKQAERLSEQLDICRRAYNELLEISIETYNNTGKGLTKFDLDDCIKYLDVDTIIVFSQVLQNINDRLNKAFRNFFRRCKEKESGKQTDVGFPRFKKWFRSITYPQMGFKFKSDRRLYVSKIGNIPIVLHRVPRGKTKTLTIKRNRANQWFAIFGCEVDNKPEKHKFPDNKVGIDVGLENFATFSDETIIQNPRFLVKSEKKLTRFQRRLSRKTKGSANRKKSILKVAIIHNKISNQRTDFLHKQSRVIADKYGFIAVEKLNINGMVHNHHLAKHINDASWNNFIQMLGYKASSAGGQVVCVDPRGTSQTCSKCGKTVPKPLSEREHKCPFCGLQIHRDLNASIEILNRCTASKACRHMLRVLQNSGMSELPMQLGNISPKASIATVGLTGSNACGDHVRPSAKKAVIVEAGTICDRSQFH